MAKVRGVGEPPGFPHVGGPQRHVVGWCYPSSWMSELPCPCGELSKKWFSTKNLWLKQVKTMFFPILTNQWFSLENLPLAPVNVGEGWRQELRFGFLLVSSCDQTLDVFTHHLSVESQGRIPARSSSLCQGEIRRSWLCWFRRQNGNFWRVRLLPIDHEGPSVPLLLGTAALWKHCWTSLFMVV